MKYLQFDILYILPIKRLGIYQHVDYGRKYILQKQLDYLENLKINLYSIKDYIMIVANCIAKWIIQHLEDQIDQIYFQVSKFELNQNKSNSLSDRISILNQKIQYLTELIEEKIFLYCNEQQMHLQISLDLINNHAINPLFTYSCDYTILSYHYLRNNFFNFKSILLHINNRQQNVKDIINFIKKQHKKLSIQDYKNRIILFSKQNKINLFQDFSQSIIKYNNDIKKSSFELYQCAIAKIQQKQIQFSAFYKELEQEFNFQKNLQIQRQFSQIKNENQFEQVGSLSHYLHLKNIELIKPFEITDQKMDQEIQEIQLTIPQKAQKIVEQSNLFDLDQSERSLKSEQHQKAKKKKKLRIKI